MPIRLGVTLGDPAGIGPEVTDAALELFSDAEDTEVEIVLFGPTEIVERLASLHRGVRPVPQGPFRGELGQPSAQSGAAAADALMSAIGAAQRGEVDALVTAPLSKEALAQAGIEARGHTEILERELGRGPVAMAFFSEQLNVVLATDHMPLREVPDRLTAERIVDVSCLLDEALRRWFGVDAPHLALAALNPHAGEAGLLGDEEQRILAPAIERAGDFGVELDGPWPADTLFRRALAGDVNGVVALYHDQALIPIKLQGLGSAVHATLGLSVPRTSPDHGTAYEIAGQDRADPTGMAAALRLALRMVA
jgi:4-hydroxythreonine-4-phosphate dehydrogenase